MDDDLQIVLLEEGNALAPLISEIGARAREFMRNIGGLKFHRSLPDSRTNPDLVVVYVENASDDAWDRLINPLREASARSNARTPRPLPGYVVIELDGILSKEARESRFREITRLTERPLIENSGLFDRPHMSWVRLARTNVVGGISSEIANARLRRQRHEYANIQYHDEQISRMLHNAISHTGASWHERNDQLEISLRKDNSDDDAANNPVVKQLHEQLRKKAGDFVPTAIRLNNSVGWKGLGPAAERFVRAIDCDTSDVPGSLGHAYDALLELASFFDLDTHLQARAGANSDPLEPEIRRELGTLIRSAAPWMRSFPTIRELDDELAAFLSRPGLLVPATEVVATAQQRKLISQADTRALLGLIEAAQRNQPQSKKAETRSVHTVRNLILAGLGGVLSFYVAATAGKFGETSILVQRISAVLIESENQIVHLMEDCQLDVRIAIEEMLSDLKALSAQQGTQGH